ncbi:MULTISPECIES: NADP-dependent malic enzyme [Clostridium]|jgi:malate dehydrogenase (oxaloacetate-decarboxylating)|uniref:NAD(P)-dependent malic enzyme n=1 Tax=Clostridium TaxID=1485 RepID=UPI000BE227C0|nr:MULTISPECIES: malic enzyme-like NAD(P)-binding protein [Clostridium]MBU6137209.1 NAD-dependent malic enzyme [Clostridium tertium]MDU1280116.1 malic enzyme-like NAD(P)-binding protein [Clostridium sp.]MDU4737992.1 malic enzyme-like NAD(P)-binding protein [Clostridium sp.]MDU7089362.1 malic enzyme-like NAD(P)-binding protein [Clostridium sp.]MDU7950189.1 malic enzyme-like NAD(P)-binding protein [Clostridium sp.]
MNIYEKSLKYHENLRGKIEITSRFKISNENDLSLAYTPGVAEPCRKIHKDPNDAYIYTRKWNTVAVISDGTAVLGLGDIGPLASLPVMEGKSILFKEFGNVDAFPLVLDTKDVDEIVETIIRISKGLGGINLEDISAPRCFEIEKRLKEKLDIPVFHDDQHGTAIVVLAGLINSLKLVNKDIKNIKIVINGAGSAGTAICKLLVSFGAKNIIVCDKSGIISSYNPNLNDSMKELALITNKDNISGNLKDALIGADVFIGVSAPNLITQEMANSMNSDSIIFAMANPIPEIFPDDAKEAGVKIIGTGRSDFPNQVNNVLAFPGIFRGALDVRASDINEEMKISAAYAIANSVDKNDLNFDFILPKAFDLNVQKAVAEAVRKAAIKSGIARI